ncbi:kinesin light chain [Colletotrichum asianum]
MASGLASKFEINADMGEGFGRWKMGPDEELMPYIDAANIACGFHAGDPSIMHKTIALCKQHGVKAGAHPGLADLLGFGRRKMEIDPKDMYCMVLYQVGALKAMLDAQGVPLAHIKPHGELFFYMQRDLIIMRAVLEACATFKVPVYGAWNAAQAEMCAELGVEFQGEVYVDIDYSPEGALLPVAKSQPATPERCYERAKRAMFLMAPRRIPASNFTIGWVCALPIELAAAEEMLDEEFAELPTQPTDSNIYSFGRIKDHNVVMACLPAGQMGTNSAATVASQMKSSFPSLRFGVLVGIGGGVPNIDQNIDIRLGDVVISQPMGQHGGVIQYDFGKTGSGGRIARTGSLNAPPQILLSASSKLRANHFRGKTNVNEFLSKICSQPKFASPGPEKDTLFKATSAHTAGPSCAKCGPVLTREKRRTTAPALFFGNIASGNQVMKDGQTRDNHSRDLGGILCFEMEAAGLMNNFPCLVIRGICDYADAHKNKQWQPYAAATAAALAKELLYTIPSTVSSGVNVANNPLHKPHFIVPFGRNKHFVGRNDILEKLLERIPPSADEDACQRTAIIGLGGIGKTQVAIEAAYRLRDAHPDCSVFWVPAVSAAMFDNHYRKIGEALKIKEIEEAREDVKDLVKDALERDDINDWLLIIDNADDIDLMFTKSGLASYIPTGRKGSVLLTTRNSVAAARYDRTFPLILYNMDPKEGLKLLHSGLAESQIDQGQSTTQLLERLAHLPLAIRQASAYLRANPATSISRYLEYCETSDEEQIALLGEDFDDQDRYESIQNPVATTWLISFENIARDKPLAAKYLSFICYLAEKDIPMALLPPGDSARQTHEAIGTLLAYAFIQQRSSTKGFDVHRLVRLVMRTWLREHGKEGQQTAETISRLSVVFPLPKSDNTKDWIVYMPHIKAALKMSRLSANGKPLWDLLRKAGIANAFLCKPEEAEKMHREVLELKQKALEPEDPEVLGSLNDLASVLSIFAGMYCNNQEQYQEAESIFRRVLQSREKILGLEHNDTMKTLKYLADTLLHRGQHAEAVKLYMKAVEVRVESHGPLDYVAIKFMGALGTALTPHKKYEESEEIFKLALEISEMVRRPEDGLTHSLLRDMGSSLAKQEKFIEAEQTSYFTLSTMRLLAYTLESQNNYEEAERLQRRVFEVREIIQGLENSDTLDCLRNVAECLSKQGKHEEAERLSQQAVEAWKRMFGPEHHFTINAMKDLSRLSSRPILIGIQRKLEEINNGMLETEEVSEELERITQQLGEMKKKLGML